MFALDIETVDTAETAAVLSIGAVYFDHTKDFEIEDLRRDSFFVKLDAKFQLQNGRTASKSTIEFWEKQDRAIQVKNYFPGPNDVEPGKGIRMFTEWFKKYHPSGAMRGSSAPIVWTRGSLDERVLMSLAKWAGAKLPFEYWVIRDVRTAVDILSGSSTGYCETSKPLNNLSKHDPVDDCIIDAMMLKYYIEVA